MFAPGRRVRIGRAARPLRLCSLSPTASRWRLTPNAAGAAFDSHASEALAVPQDIRVLSGLCHRNGNALAPGPATTRGRGVVLTACTRSDRRAASDAIRPRSPRRLSDPEPLCSLDWCRRLADDWQLRFRSLRLQYLGVAGASTRCLGNQPPLVFERCSRHRHEHPPSAARRLMTAAASSIWSQRTTAGCLSRTNDRRNSMNTSLPFGTSSRMKRRKDMTWLPSIDKPTGVPVCTRTRQPDFDSSSFFRPRARESSR